jgi:alpha,alpha-trehalase
MKVVTTLSPRDYDAVLFDLDGVLTRTASVHASAWKKLFDGFLKQRATQAGEPFVPFDIDADYHRYVDGKPRYAGVADFLDSRRIELPMGGAEDGPDVQSVIALGNLKDRYFLQHLKQHGVDSYETSISLVRKLRALRPIWLRHRCGSWRAREGAARCRRRCRGDRSRSSRGRSGTAFRVVTRV